MNNVLFFLFVLCIKTAWAMHCSDLKDLSRSTIYPPNSLIQITGNASGNFCIGWIAETEGDEYLQVSQKLPSTNWSFPEAISPRDPKRTIPDFKLKLDEIGNIFALWEMNWSKECTSNIFFSEKIIHQSWTLPSLLIQDLFEYSSSLMLTSDGWSHIISPIISDDPLEIASFHREKLINKTLFCKSIPVQKHLRSNFIENNHLHARACWHYLINENEVATEYSDFQNGKWSNPKKIGPVFVNSGFGSKCFILGPENNNFLLYTSMCNRGEFSYEDRIFVSNNLSNKIELRSLGRENDIIQHPTFATDQSGNVCIVWEIKRAQKKGIGVALKTPGIEWIDPIEAFPVEGKYERPKVVEGSNYNFVIVWEKKLGENTCIFGSSLDVQTATFSEINQLSPPNEKCSSTSLYISKKGKGYIAWANENDRDTIIQVAELHQ